MRELIRIPEAGRQQEPMEGVLVWRNPLNSFVVVRTHYRADPARRGNWRLRASPKYGGLRSWRWRKEQEIDWDAASGKPIFELWDPSIHVIKPFSPPEHWPRWLLFDPGWTNPAAMDWVTVDVDAEPNQFQFLPIHVYREFYKQRHSAEQCAGIARQWSRIGDDELEFLEAIIVDPAARQEHQSAASPENVTQVAETVLERFMNEIEDLGWDVPVDTGNNDKTNAIEELIARVGYYWIDQAGLPLVDDDDFYREPTIDEILEGAQQVLPTLFFHETCLDGPREMQKYRWKDWASAQVAERNNEPETPIDKDDHVVTNLIRFTNRLRELRREGDVDLSEFRPRRRPREWKPMDEQIAEEYRTRAARYRQRLVRRMAGKA